MKSGRQKDGQTKRHTDRQSGLIGRQADRKAGRRAGMKIDRLEYTQSGTQTGIQTRIQVDRQKGGKTESKQADRQRGLIGTWADRKPGRRPGWQEDRRTGVHTYWHTDRLP